MQKKFFVTSGCELFNTAGNDFDAKKSVKKCLLLIVSGTQYNMYNIRMKLTLNVRVFWPSVLSNELVLTNLSAFINNV